MDQSIKTHRYRDQMVEDIAIQMHNILFEEHRIKETINAPVHKISNQTNKDLFPSHETIILVLLLSNLMNTLHKHIEWHRDQFIPKQLKSITNQWAQLIMNDIF